MAVLFSGRVRLPSQEELPSILLLARKETRFAGPCVRSGRNLFHGGGTERFGLSFSGGFRGFEDVRR